MKRLKNSLLFDVLKNNYFIIVIFFIINLLIYKGHFLLIILDIMYLIYIFAVHKKFAFIIIILNTILFFNLFIRDINYKKLYKEDIQNSLKVKKINKLDKNYQVYFKYKSTKIIAYMDEPLKLGSYYYVKGTLTLVDTAHFENGFNYREHLKNKNIQGILEIDTYEYKKRGISIFLLNNLLNKYIDEKLDTKSKGMIKALTIGNKFDFDDNLYDSIGKIGISHLFVISGLHVNMISSLILFILNKIKLKDKYTNIITIIILFLYYVICGYLISVLRVIISYILKYINKLFNFDFSNKDIISINIILVLLINPKLAFQYSFLLSYTISTSIILCNKILESKGKFKNIKTGLKISILSILVTIPIIIKINPTLNLLSIVYNIIYIPFVSYIMLPFSFIAIILPITENIYNLLYILFSNVTIYLSNIRIFNLTLSYPNIILITVYYFILYKNINFLELKKINYKYLCSLIILVMFWNNSAFFNINNDVYFLDLPKGESTFISKSFNQENILIDTGENGYDDIILFLKYKGIKRIDKIFISHSDSDHNGMLDEIIDEFNVKTVYINPYDDVTKSIVKKENIKCFVLKEGDYIKEKDIYVKVISPSKNYKNSNDNSLVLYCDIFKTKYLFTGDITTKVEEELNLNNVKIDILKLAHHGSNTSTSINFLDKLEINKKQKIVICMNGYKNQFSFPTTNTVKKINANLYITSTTKTICIRKNIFNDKLRIKTT